MPEQLQQAAKIVEQLQEWIELHQSESLPYACLSWSPYILQITIGDVCVFDSEEHPGALSLDNCKRAWLAYVDSMEPFRA
jgi:hypothetical protein